MPQRVDWHFLANEVCNKKVYSEKNTNYFFDLYRKTDHL
ncbi:hypothetical protein P1059_00094 [Pasteurella multocida subsp. gallicida P1059]|nr:hypothetical protein PMCN06_1222 [Pasteurella multocida subsp. multocida str. HN06]EJZ79920.1 hypothetical protein X73_00085 [Pasteurella multocida subsp. gallicida X73]EJZ80994.1 hypothetical protein P1059_00094 [Pasteurella multocida subsp. gallicida P1059]